MQGDGLSPDEAIRQVRLAVENSGLMPDKMDYVEHEPSDNDNTGLPATIIQPLTEAQISNFNTDRVGFVTDDDGNRVGRVFNSEYRLDLQIDIWVAEQSDYDERTLGNNLYKALYEYSSSGPSKSLADEVWRFRVGDGTTANDLTTSPVLRRWRQDFTLWAYHRFDTTEDYVSSVNYPSELSSSDGEDSLQS